MGLTSVYDVGEAHVNNANLYWWAYLIAAEFPGVVPHDVKNWDVDDILETLARIKVVDAHRKEPLYAPKGGGA